MNRLVLIGNGFDLAHGLLTSYKDFFYWYWGNRVRSLCGHLGKTSDDGLCQITILQDTTWHGLWCNNSIRLNKASGEELFYILTQQNEDFEIVYTPFFENIHKSIETKGWVDIENEYYRLLEHFSIESYSEKEIAKLNNQLRYLQKLLTEYLIEINQKEVSVNKNINERIYAPIQPCDISIEAKDKWKQYIHECRKKDLYFWRRRLNNYGIIGSNCNPYLLDISKPEKNVDVMSEIPRPYGLPESIMLLDFNYTKTVNRYMKTEDIFIHNQIHGRIEAPDGMIFGYGDEFDEKYRKLQDLNNNDCLTNIKTIKYQESDNYRKVLKFIESAPFQVCIMGHSCGNSDRTLLNTIFEHKNCISIKPYYYKKSDGTDNYIELIQNISRNFKDMKLMRDRVVNKMYCEPLIGEKPGVVVMG